MQKPDFNGPSRELHSHGHLDESVYCVNCGTIFVLSGSSRDCPSCTNAAAIEDLEERIERLEALTSEHGDVLADVSEKLTDLGNRLESIRANTQVLRDLAEAQEGDA